MRKDPKTLLDELERLMYGTGPEAEANREFEKKWGPILRSDPNSPMGSLLRENGRPQGETAETKMTRCGPAPRLFSP